MLLPKKTRNTVIASLFLSIFFVGFFVFSTQVANAQGTRSTEAAPNIPLIDIGQQLRYAFSALLYAALKIASLTVSLGAVLLEFVLNPVAFSSLFNLSAVYTLWMMVRDFFNLFFILVILFIAFSTIFQIQAYNYKKLLFQLLLMALLVNFSFPVSRFIIDAANVPMYFFVNSIAPSAPSPGKAVSENLFTATKLETVLLPDVKDLGSAALHKDPDIHRKLIQATIFVFIFGVSLIVLGALLLIRALVLLVLVIFSPIGFIGGVIPGFGTYAKKWWDALLSNAFFGPTAALMLLVAIKVMGAFNLSTAQTELNTIAQNVGDLNLASLAQFFIPLILIWMSITVGKSFGIAGSAQIVGSAQKFAKGIGRKVSGLDSAQKNWQSFQKERQGRKDAKLAAKGGNVGARFGKRYTEGVDMLQSAVGSERSRNFSMDRIDAKQQARVKEEATRNRINDRTSDSELLRQRDAAREKNDKAHLAAIHQEMAKRDSLAGRITHGDQESLGKYFVDRGGVENAVMKETREKVAEKNASVAYDNDVEKMTKAFESGKIKIDSQTAASLTSSVLQAGLRSGKVNQQVLDDLGKDGEKAAQISNNIGTAVRRFEAEFAARRRRAASPQEQKALDKQRVNAHMAYFAQTGDFHSDVANDRQLQGAVFKKADATTLAVLSRDEQKLAHVMPKLLEHAGASKTVNTLAKLAEDGVSIRMSTDMIVSTAQQNGPGTSPQTLAAAEAAHSLMGKDHRFAWVANPRPPRAQSSQAQGGAPAPAGIVNQYGRPFAP